MSVKKKALDRAKKLDRARVLQILARSGHPQDPGLPMEQLWEKMASMVQAGKLQLSEVRA